MATYNGRESRVSVSADTTEAIVTELGNWKINTSADEIDTTAFGDGWGKSDVGMKKWNGSLTGFCDPEDTDGQEVLEDAFQNGTLVPDIRFYIQYTTTSGEKNIYYTPDTVTDSNAGARVTSYDVEQDKAGVATLNMNFSGSGPLKRVIETVA